MWYSDHKMRQINDWSRHIFVPLDKETINCEKLTGQRKLVHMGKESKQGSDLGRKLVKAFQGVLI